MKEAEAQMWAVKRPDGTLVSGVASDCQYVAQTFAARNEMSWGKAEELGYRLVRVRVEEICDV